MNKEKIEKAKEDLSFFNEGDYITKEMEHSARVLEGYIKQLENEIEMYKDFKEIANMKMGDRNVIRAIKNYKTLDKVTDKLKEMSIKYTQEYQTVENLELIKQDVTVLQELSCVIEDIEEILNIIEGEKYENTKDIKEE